MPDEVNRRITYNEGSQDISLPKWPAFVVSGKKVSEELATNIVIRTDSSLPDFQFSSNDKEFEKTLNEIFRFPWELDISNKEYETHWDKVQKLHKDLHLVKTNYLNNSQILSAYIGGPHGWCNWNGDIFSNTTNLGKWPEVTEVAEDWSLIATAFPQLDLKCHLYSGESCEDHSRPVVEFVVKNGIVEVNPLAEGVAPLAPLVSDIHNNLMNLFALKRERGITAMGLINKLTIVYGGDIPRYGDE